MRFALSVVGLFLSVSSSRSAAPITVDLILKNGRVWTVDARQATAQAIGIVRDRIVFVGNDDELAGLVGPQTRVIDLQGKRVLPGFYDSHVHFLSGGELLSQVNLKDAKDEADFGERLKKFDRELPRDRWILGGNWDHDRTFRGKLPTAAMLDRYVPNRPVLIHRYDGHMALANTKALQLAAVTAATVDPEGGVIERAENGKTPTGILKDNAIELVGKLVPASSEEAIAEAIQAALHEANRLGVTSVQDMDGSDDATRRKLFRLYQRLARRGRLTCRIDFRLPIAAVKELEELGIEANFGNDRLKLGGVKGFMDGSLGSSTAKMFEPFAAEKENTGVFVTPRAEMSKMILAADRDRLSIAVHAIGDRANAELLEMFAEAAKTNGPRDRRFRIEHAQHLRERDFVRFKEGNVIASMQPYHIVDDGRWAQGRIGTKRCATSYANRSLLDAGAKLAFGSDWPVAPLDPILGIAAAVHRRTLDGKNPDGWFPEQKITVKEAVEAYTMGSAYAGFQEGERGSISVGKWADVVVLSHDILDEKQRDRIAQTKVVLTVMGGNVVWEAK